MVAMPTGGAQTVTAMLAGQVPGMRSAGLDLRVNAMNILRAKRAQLLAQIDQLRREREAKKLLREQKRKQTLGTGLAVGGTLLGAGIGGAAAGGVAGGLTAGQGAILGTGLGSSLGTGLGQLVNYDPRGAVTIGGGLNQFLNNQANLQDRAAELEWANLAEFGFE